MNTDNLDLRINNADDEDLPAPTKKTMPLFYVVDNSGSMAGDKIQTVNAALEEIMGLLDEISKSNDDADIKIGCITFDTSAKIITKTPVSPADFKYEITTNRGLTALGDALTKLDWMLSRDHFLKGDNFVRPVIIFLSDGAPTDEWESKLKKLSENNWYKYALKFSFAIGKDANEPENKSILMKLTGSKSDELVMEVNNAVKLREYLKEISVVASKFNTRSATTNASEDPEEMAKDVKKEAKKNAQVDPATTGKNKGKDPFGTNW